MNDPRFLKSFDLFHWRNLTLFADTHTWNSFPLINTRRVSTECCFDTIINNLNMNQRISVFQRPLRMQIRYLKWRKE